jgi:hypothetical protein
MQEIRSFQPLKIFSRLVLPAWMSSLRHALASKQGTQGIPAQIAAAGSSVAVDSELGRNAKRALECQLRKAYLHLVPPDLFEPIDGPEYQPAKQRKAANEAGGLWELVPCKLPGNSKKARIAWQVSKAPDDMFDLFHPGRKPLAGFFRCSSSCKVVHTLFASNAACHAASLLYFTTSPLQGWMIVMQPACCTSPLHHYRAGWCFDIAAKGQYWCCLHSGTCCGE